MIFTANTSANVPWAEWPKIQHKDVAVEKQLAIGELKTTMYGEQLRTYSHFSNRMKSKN